MDTWLPYIFAIYKWIGLAVGAVVFLSTEGAKKDRALEALVSAIAWPYVVWRHFSPRDV
jgi:hypothetical protein